MGGRTYSLPDNVDDISQQLGGNQRRQRELDLMVDVGDGMHLLDKVHIVKWRPSIDPLTLIRLWHCH